MDDLGISDQSANIAHGIAQIRRGHLHNVTPVRACLSDKVHIAQETLQ